MIIQEISENTINMKEIGCLSDSLFLNLFSKCKYYESDSVFIYCIIYINEGEKRHYFIKNKEDIEWMESFIEKYNLMLKSNKTE